jgi:arabinofuranosyltransferase
MRARVSRLAWLPPLCAFAVFVFEARRYSGKSLYFVDDPFISMRFAANLVTRGELSFNPGDRIEGYSNLLHVLMHAAVFKLQGGVPDAVRAIDGAALVVFAATLLEALLLGVLALRARRQGAEGTAWYCAWVLTMASWPFAFWASAGMETPIEGLLYVSILLATTVMASRRAAASGTSLAIVGLLLAGVTLLRFEGVIVAVTIALALSVHFVRTQQTRSAVFLTVPVVLAAAAYHLWRVAYFGTLLPNTFVAKATGGSALARLQAGASYSGGWAAFLGGGLGLAVVALAVARARPLDRAAFARIVEDPVRLVAGALVLVKVALVIWGGGDWMPGWRMLLPVTPIALFLIFRSLLAYVEDGPALLTSRSGAVVLALLVVVCGRGNAELSSPLGTIPDEAGSGKKIPRNYVEAGRFLERTLGGSSEEVAIGEAGLVPFVARDVRFMDLFGLVDRDMARQPGWMHHRVHVAHVLERAPGAVMFAHLQLLPPYGPHQYGPELLASSAFHASYRLVDVGPELEAFGWALYLRRDLDPAAHDLVWASHDPRAPGPGTAPAK